MRDNHDQYADYVFDALPHVAVDGHGKDVRELSMGMLRPGGTYVMSVRTPRSFSFNSRPRRNRKYDK